MSKGRIEYLFMAFGDLAMLQVREMSFSMLSRRLSQKPTVYSPQHHRPNARLTEIYQPVTISTLGTTSIVMYTAFSATDPRSTSSTTITHRPHGYLLVLQGQLHEASIA